MNGCMQHCIIQSLSYPKDALQGSPAPPPLPQNRIEAFYSLAALCLKSLHLVLRNIPLLDLDRRPEGPIGPPGPWDPIVLWILGRHPGGLGTRLCFLAGHISFLPAKTALHRHARLVAMQAGMMRTNSASANKKNTSPQCMPRSQTSGETRPGIQGSIHNKPSTRKKMCLATRHLLP